MTAQPLLQSPRSVAELTALGRVRLSEHFFMREMLYSEVSNLHGVPNIPENPAAAIEAGRHLCKLILEPLHAAFGGIVVRSAYRSPTLNDFCYRRRVAGDEACYCGSNEYAAARHIWDRPDPDGYLGATATVLVPWYLDHYQRTGEWQPLAWWLRDNIAHYDDIQFFPWQCTFNIRWYQGPSDQVIRQNRPGQEEVTLTRRGLAGFAGSHAAAYPGFPPIPPVPQREPQGPSVPGALAPPNGHQGAGEKNREA